MENKWVKKPQKLRPQKHKYMIFGFHSGWLKCFWSMLLQSIYLFFKKIDSNSRSGNKPLPGSKSSFVSASQTWMCSWIFRKFIKLHILISERWGQGVCISHKLPGCINVAGLWTTLQAARPRTWERSLIYKMRITHSAGTSPHDTIHWVGWCKWKDWFLGNRVSLSSELKAEQLSFHSSPLWPGITSSSRG